jgi:hypothetical protein
MSQTVNNDFPVLATVGKAFAAPVINARQLVHVLWPWVLAMVPVLLIFGWLAWPWMERAITGDSEARLALGWTGTLLSIPFLSGIAVGWHRFLLRGELALGAARIWGYMLSAAAVWVAANIAASVGLWLLRSPTPEGGVIALILTCVFSVLALRVSLVLPAVAVLSPVSWVEVWKVTRGYTWPIVFGAILAAAPLFIGQIALGTLITPDMTQSSYVLSTVVLGLAEAVLLVVSVGYLSFAYQWFFERNGYASGRAS